MVALVAKMAAPVLVRRKGVGRGHARLAPAPRIATVGVLEGEGGAVAVGAERPRCFPDGQIAVPPEVGRQPGGAPVAATRYPPRRAPCPPEAATESIRVARSAMVT